MNYLVTGGTGNFGGLALTFLKKLIPVENIFALVRSEEKAADLKAKGFNLRIGDYADPASLETAFTNIDRILFVSGAPGNRQQEHQNVVDAAKKMGVEYLAYTSFAQAESSSADLAQDHKYTEAAIKKAGIAHTFLRNNWYLENEMPIIGGALATGKFIYSAGLGKTGWALRREYAEVGAKAVAGADFPEILELSGQPVTYQTLGEAVEKASGKKIEISNTSNEEFVASLVAAGLPEPVAEMFLGFQMDIKNNVLDVTSDHFEKALGRPLTPLVEAVKEINRLKKISCRIFPVADFLMNFASDAMLF